MAGWDADMSLNWSWSFAFETLPFLLTALKTTVVATIAGSALALAGGLPLALIRLSRYRLVAGIARVAIDFIRGTPLLIQLYCFFYVLPDVGIRLDPMWTGVLALGLHYSAYTAEAYRAGIQAVPVAQREAAVALGLGRWRAFRRVVFPQALPPVVPVLGNYVIAMFKDTPMLSTITVIELLHTAKDIGAETFRYLEPFTMVGVLFLMLSLLAAGATRLLERQVRAARA